MLPGSLTGHHSCQYFCPNQPQTCPLDVPKEGGGGVGGEGGRRRKREEVVKEGRQGRENRQNVVVVCVSGGRNRVGKVRRRVQEKEGGRRW